jgi:DNA-binding NtrC family response regulator
MSEKTIRGDTAVNSALDAPERSHAVPRVVAVSGPGAGRAVAMTRALATVGRHATNDLVIDDKRVSGVHLDLRRVGERIHVRDPGSTNGTWLGPHRITDIELAVGAELVVGDTTLCIEADDNATPAAVSADESFGELVGASTTMREIFSTLDRLSKKTLSILFQGEAGTGKEEMARAVVARSPRAAAPFIVVDVTSVPAALIDTVLFGQELPAQGGVVPSVFESANGGTVFVDEVGQLAAATQSKLLRLLERQELTRVGGHAVVKVDVRVLASTSHDLRNEIEHGRFREDLYFRLAQVRIFVPALRDRIEDIPLLCRKLLRVIAKDATLAIDDDAVAQLVAHPWPGNVRELRNALERAAALTSDDVIRRADVAGEGFGFRGTPDERSPLDVSGSFKDAKERAVERFESTYLSALMRRCNGNVSLASREADIARHHLRELLKKRELYGVSWDKHED